MVFNIGEQVVYPNQGIARVEAIRSIETADGPTRFYVLRLAAGGSVVMVPVDGARAVGVRPPIGKAECGRLLELLAAPFAAPATQWKDRQKELVEQTRTGDIFTQADVLKKLTYLDSLKPLPYSEKRMLERARLLVIGEFALAARRTHAEAEAVVDHALATARPRAA
jgi:CarD family transcriptional regulator